MATTNAKNTASKKSSRAERQYEEDLNACLPVDLGERIRSGYYESKVPFPARTDYVIVEEIETQRLGKQTLKGFDEEGYRKARDAHNADEQRLHTEFRKDALADCGITDHPKADKCFALAWEHGHSSGYHDVLNHLREFSELIKD